MTLPHPWHCACARCKPTLPSITTYDDMPKWVIDGVIIVSARDYYTARELGYKLLGTGSYPKTVEPCVTPKTASTSKAT